MSLENVALLPLLALVFLPIILHLLDRRRARTVMWPAVQFLLAADRRILRRLRLLETLLILSRTLALVFLILAVLGPFRTESVLGRDASERRRGAAIVIDTSLSMGYRGSAGGGSSSLERAREMALHLLEQFDAGDRVVVIDDQAEASWIDAPSAPQVGDPPVSDARRDTAGPSERAVTEPPPPDVPYDLETVRARTRGLELRSGTFRLVRALGRAVDVLETLATETREIFILTDVTATCFPAEDTPGLRLINSRLQRLPTPPTVSLLDCGAERSRNRSVSFVRSGPLAAGTDTEVKFEVGLGLVEEEARAPIVVRLLGGLEELTTGEVESSESRNARIELVHSFDRGGTHRLTAQIPPDGLAGDDTCYHVLDVHEHIPVLVAGALAGEDGPTRFVRLALAPKAPDAPEVDVIFQSDFTDRIEDETLARYRVVIICDLPQQSPEAILQLEEYVRAGGGLIMFCGDETHSDSWNRHAFRGRYGLMPGRLSTRQTSGQLGSLHPGNVRTDHGALSVFAAPDAGDLERIDIRRFTRLVDLGPDAVVLSTVDSGEGLLPWIVEKPCGRGRVLLLTTSATTGDTDLPRTSLFLPLLHQLARYVASTDPRDSDLRCGQPIRFPFDESASADTYLVVDPRGEQHPIVAEVERGQPVGVFRDTTTPGFYEVRVGKAASPQAPPRVYAVNFPPGESDLERLGEDRIEDAREQLGLDVARSVEDLTGRQVEVTTRQRFWPHMIAAAILFAFIELLLTHRLARGRV